MIEPRMVSLGFTPEYVPAGQHLLYIFNNDEERLRILSQFFESGLRANEKVLYLVDTRTPRQLIEEFLHLDVDFLSYVQDGWVVPAETTYCPNGRFSISKMLERIAVFHAEALEEGYAGARVTGEMSWSLDPNRLDFEDLLEYETCVDGVLAKHPCTACCQYDARRFDAATMQHMRRVHPVMIVDRKLVNSPDYVEPDARTWNRTHIQ